MKMFVKVVSVLFLLCLSACAQETVKQQSVNPVMLSSKPAKLPGWCSKKEEYFKKGDLFFFIGEASSAKNENMAKKISIASAFSRVSNYFGVKVDSSMVSEEREVDGVYTYDIGVRSKLTGSPVTVKDYTLKDVYTEKWSSAGGEKYKVRVLLEIPSHEIARMQKKIDALCGWYISTDVDLKRFNKDIQTQTKLFAGKMNLNLTPDILQIDEDYESITVEKLASVSDTAFFLKVNVRSSKTEEIKGEWYTNIDIETEYISLLENKVISTRNTAVKGAAFSKEGALENGVKKAFEKIIEEVSS